MIRVTRRKRRSFSQEKLEEEPSSLTKSMERRPPMRLGEAGVSVTVFTSMNRLRDDLRNEILDNRLTITNKLDGVSLYLV